MKTMQKNVPVGFEAAAQYLNSYSGDFVFLRKLQNYYNRFNIMSEKQWQAVSKCMLADAKKTRTSQLPPMIPACDVHIVLKRFIAQKFAKDHKIAFTPFTYTVKSVLWETNKAFGVVIKPNYANVSVCMCCGKELTDWRSQATGMGIVCAERLGVPYIKDRNEIDRFKKAISIKFDAIGELTVTLPKSQIKDGLGSLNALCHNTSVATVTQPVVVAHDPATDNPATVVTHQQTKPIVSLILMKELSYDEHTQTLSADISSISGYNKNSNLVTVTNDATGNTVTFKLTDTNTDGDGFIYSWEYEGTYNNLFIKLILNNC